MDSNASNMDKTLLRILGILCMILIFSVILHKGSVDISALAKEYSGQEFWRALGRYLIGNLAGG